MSFVIVNRKISGNINMKRFATILIVGILLQSSLVFGSESTKPDVKLKPVNKGGYKCLFIGHSFFIPVAKALDAKPAQLGFLDHKQKLVFSGGASGAPGRLWKGSKRPDIQAILETGKIQLLGMTYYNSQNSSFDDYKRWIDYTLKYNPNAKFLIALSWGANGAKRDTSEFSKANRKTHSSIYETVLALRKTFPGKTILCVNYGPAAIELKKLFEAGQLPDVESMVSNNKSPAVYRDAFGHAGPILKDLSSLVWLAILYDVDLTASDLDTGYKTDLKKIAMAIVTQQAHNNKVYSSPAPRKGIKKVAAQEN